jgi:dihydropteroate synthase
MLINFKGFPDDLNEPIVMGILNLTPDSFYNKSRSQTLEDIDGRIQEILKEGGKIIDVGGYSTRPNATDISEEEEWQRLAPALKHLKKHYPGVIVSIDTFRSDIARKAVDEYGVAMINDVSGGSMDDRMFEVVANLQVPYILTHTGASTNPKLCVTLYQQNAHLLRVNSASASVASLDFGIIRSPHVKGTPHTMQQTTYDQDLSEEVMLYFAEKLHTLQSLGVNDVIIDPGFGFGKTLDQNYELMRMLPELKLHKRPLLIGVSRKSMIYNYLNCSIEDSLHGTTILHTFALMNGANILRVHDVKPAVEAIQIISKLKNK